MPIIDKDKVKKGDKVKFMFPENGFEPNRKLANKHLKINQVYTVINVNKEKWSINLILKEAPRHAYNSSMFAIPETQDHKPKPAPKIKPAKPRSPWI